MRGLKALLIPQLNPLFPQIHRMQEIIIQTAVPLSLGTRKRHSRKYTTSFPGSLVFPQEGVVEERGSFSDLSPSGKTKDPGTEVGKYQILIC